MDGSTRDLNIEDGDQSSHISTSHSLSDIHAFVLALIPAADAFDVSFLKGFLREYEDGCAWSALL
jgi:hypothetical protein